MSQLFILKYSFGQGFLILKESKYFSRTEINYFSSNSFDHFGSVNLFLAGVNFSQIKIVIQEQASC